MCDAVVSYVFFFFSSRRRHTRFDCDWSSDVCSSDLATIDVRQHAHVHRAVLATLLRDPDWTARPPADRLTRLRRALEQGERPSGSPDDQAMRTLDVFKAIADCRARFGPDAIGPYIISMAQGADDVLAVLLLPRR